MARDLLTPEEAGNASASEEVRRWDHAFTLGGLSFLAAFAISLGLLWKLGEPVMGRLDAVLNGFGALKYLSTQQDMDWLPWGELKHQPWILVRLVVSLLISAAISAWIGRTAAQPMSRVRHIDGPRLLVGKEAKLACKSQSAPDGWLALHEDLVLSKAHLTGHVLIVGGVGKGKTQIIWKWIKQLTEMGSHGRKMLIYDVKGDFTAALPNAALVSPWDARSYYWSIAEDVDTPQAAATFAQSMIPSKEGEFWGVAAQSIVMGVLHQLIHDKQHLGVSWGWVELSEKLAMDAYELKDLLLQHYPAGARLLEDPGSTTALNILQTVSAHTRVISQLATAWKGAKKGISFKRWSQDEWTGRRQIILAAGPDADMTRRLISTIINVLTPNIINPALPDDQMGRTLAFVCDEFTSMGKLEDIGRLVSIGRSKGVTMFLGFQAIDQIKSVYSTDFANGLMSMVSTHVFCSVSMGETQNMLAGHFGKRRVSMTTHSRSPGALGVSVAQHEEQRQVVAPSVLGQDLGVVTYKGGFTIKALVSIGSDPMILEYQGEPLPKLRPSFVAAEWTKGIAKREPIPKVEEYDEETTSALQQPLARSKEKENEQGREPEDRLEALARREGLRP